MAQYAVHTTQRRWLDLNKLPDGNFEMKIMFGDDEKPIATLVFTQDEWEKLVKFSGELEAK